MEPSPRHLGFEVSALDIAFDRGAFTTVEVPYLENAGNSRSGWATISTLPRDHVHFDQQQRERQEQKRAVDHLKALDERYRTATLRLASEECQLQRQEKRRAEIAGGTAASGAMGCCPENDVEEDPSSARPATARGTGTGRGHGSWSEDYWMSLVGGARGGGASPLGVAARASARSQRGEGEDGAGLRVRPGTRPTPRGLFSEAAAHQSAEVAAVQKTEVLTSARSLSSTAPAKGGGGGASWWQLAARPCGPGRCFPSESAPSRARCLP